MKICPKDPRMSWHNVAEWSAQEHGLRPERVPQDWRSRFEEAAAWRAVQPAGVKLRFRTDSRNVVLHWKQWETTISMLDQGEAYCAGELVGVFNTSDPASKMISRFRANGEGMADWEILLPWSVALEIESIDVDDDARVDECQVDIAKGKMLCYGDSITQGYCASGPSLTWPHLLADKIKWNTINLGFGGAAFCEPEVAEYIASRSDWDALTVTAGINTAASGRESASSFHDTYKAFLEIVRSTHPYKPILCITPMFYSTADGDDTWLNACGCRVSEYREAVESVVSERSASGDKHIHLLDGLAIIGSEEYLADTVHPIDEGMRRVAVMIAEKWKENGLVDEIRIQ